MKLVFVAALLLLVTTASIAKKGESTPIYGQAKVVAIDTMGTLTIKHVVLSDGTQCKIAQDQFGTINAALAMDCKH